MLNPNCIAKPFVLSILLELIIKQIHLQYYVNYKYTSVDGGCEGI